MQIGARSIIETARRLGVESPLDPVASLSLGVSALTPLELTRAYAVLAAGGSSSPLRAWSQVLAADGGEIAAREVRSERAVDPAAAYLVTSALAGAVERGTAQRLRALGVRSAVAAKTGTTNDYRDAWLVGYTPEIALGVWVGFDDGEPVGATGAAAALPVFADFLLRGGYANRRAEFARPDGIESVDVDPSSGLRAGFGCPGEPEVFLAGTQPEQSCGLFARLREPEPEARGRGPWWLFGLGDEEQEVSAAPAPRREDAPERHGPPAARRASAPEHSGTCLVRFGQIQHVAPFRGGAEYAYRVAGTAGQAGWLRLSAPFPRRVEGFPVRIEPGRFDRTLEIELPGGADGLLVELELESGKRCTDSARLPAN
jgi:membrane peptidoglycan carboxypeptidase